MNISVLKSKIHNAKVTEAIEDYIGSIGIDESLITKAGIYENEKVLVVNLTNGKRWETYVIKTKAGSGIISVNGGGAKLCTTGDLLVIMAFSSVDSEKKVTPEILILDQNNNIIQNDNNLPEKTSDNDSENNLIYEWIEHADSEFYKELFAVKKTYHESESALQKIQVLDLYATGKTLLLNNHFQVTERSKNPYHEFLTILGTCFCNGKINSLICGGGDGITASKILKINSDSNCKIIEYDKEVVRICKEYLPDWNDYVFDNNINLNIVYEDAIKYVYSEKDNVYNCAIIDITPPHSGCDIEFWSGNFLINLKRVLKENCTTVFLGEHTSINSKLNITFYKTCKRYFNTVYPFVIPYTGTCLFFLSDMNITNSSLFSISVELAKTVNFMTVNEDSIKAAYYLGKTLIKSS